MKTSPLCPCTLISKGVRQGGILSSELFHVYVDDLDVTHSIKECSQTILTSHVF